MALVFLGDAKVLKTRDYFEIWQYEQLKREIFKCAYSDSITEKCFGVMLLSLFVRTESGLKVFLDPPIDEQSPVDGWDLAKKFSLFFLQQNRAGSSEAGSMSFKLVSFLRAMGYENRRYQRQDIETNSLVMQDA